MNTIKAGLALSVVAVILTAVAGCDIGVNPLLFDAPPATARFRVDTADSLFGKSAVVNLQGTLDNLDADIDSVKIINITLQIDSAAGTDTAMTITGSAYVDANRLFSVTNLGLSAFFTEHSIFDSSLAGAPVFDPLGVAHMFSVLRMQPVPAMTFVASGSASKPGLHFTITLRLYTQVYTTP
jgi:hypothetical protein